MAGNMLTVLMTVKNGEPYVKEAVESILGQTYTDFYFLILDNASTDNTCNIIKSYRDSRINFVELPRDIGQTNALNKGLSMIETEYVARMDADDVSLPERFERQMAFLNKMPNVALLGTGADMIDEKGEFLFRSVFPTTHQNIVNSFPLMNPFAHPSVLFKLDAVREKGGYNSRIRYVQDFELWIEMAKKFRLSNLKEILVKIRLHSGQTTLGFRKAMRLSEELLLADQIISLPEISENAKQAGMFQRAFILFKLGYRKKAFRLSASSFCNNPAGCLLNAYIWKGIMIKVMYHLKKTQYSTKKYLTTKH